MLCCAGKGDAIPSTESRLADKGRGGLETCKNSRPTWVRFVGEYSKELASKLTKNEASLDVIVHNTVPNHNRTAFHFLDSNMNYHAVL